MKLAIQINGHPGRSDAAATGYQFIKAALAKNHDVILVFFYYDGVFCGMAPPALRGEPGTPAPQWAELADTHAIDLVLCVSAAERRGLGASAADSADRPALMPGFRLGGLGEWVDACLRCDRFLTFSA